MKISRKQFESHLQLLQNSPNKAFREVIVIHNFKEVENQDILSHIWETQVKQIFATDLLERLRDSRR